MRIINQRVSAMCRFLLGRTSSPTPLLNSIPFQSLLTSSAESGGMFLIVMLMLLLLLLMRNFTATQIEGLLPNFLDE